MILHTGYAPDKGIHVVSVVVLESGVLQFEPVIVPEDVQMHVFQNVNGVRWELTPWNQVIVMPLQPGELPPSIPPNMPLVCPPTPGYSISRLERPRPSPSQWRLAANLATGRHTSAAPYPLPSGKSGSKKKKAASAAPQTSDENKSEEKPTGANRTRARRAQTAQVETKPTPTKGQRVRQPLDIMYANASKKDETPLLLLPPPPPPPQQSENARPESPKETANGSTDGDGEGEEWEDHEEEDAAKDGDHVQGGTKKGPIRAKAKVKKGKAPKKGQDRPWNTQPAYSLSSSHTVLSEEDFLHTFECRPINQDGTREIVYKVDGVEKTATLPRSTYGKSLHDILPMDVPRKFWMQLVRHPLIWDNLRSDIKANNELPTREHDEWTRSLQSLGLHSVPDWTSIADRPPHSMQLLIRLAILGSPYQVLSTNDIRMVLMAKYRYFRIDFNNYWYNQISNVHSRQEYHSWLGIHPLLSGSQVKYWNVTDITQLDIPEAYKFPVIKLSRVKDKSGQMHLAVESNAGEFRQVHRHAPGEILPFSQSRPMVAKAKTKAQSKATSKPKGPRGNTRLRRLRNLQSASPPPSTVTSDELGPESEDELSIAELSDLELGTEEAEDVSMENDEEEGAIEVFSHASPSIEQTVAINTSDVENAIMDGEGQGAR